MAHIKLIVGLGNPGPEYTETRHNVGAWFVEKIAHAHHETLRLENKFHGLIGALKINTTKCFLLLPTTYMNDSGIAVLAAAQFYKIAPEEILIAHDELDFPSGQIRLKFNGGHGGHNGLRDIIQRLHSHHFLRLRIGIGHPGHKDKVTPYVLGKPSTEERKRIQESLENSMAVLPNMMKGDIDEAMRELH